MSRIPDIEYSALRMLENLDRRAQALGVEYWLVALNPRALSVVTKAGLAAGLGRRAHAVQRARSDSAIRRRSR